MPFRSARKARAYGKRWRKRHKGYMRDYGRQYRGPGKKSEAARENQLAMAAAIVTHSQP